MNWTSPLSHRLLRTDVVAGVSVAGMIVPEAVAYAAIAGLPSRSALVAAMAGCLAYAVVGRSRYAIVSTTSSSAILLAAAFAALGIAGTDRVVATTIIALLTAVMFLVAWFAKLGSLGSFISRPVLCGFAFGLAVTIVIHQLPSLIGIKVTANSILEMLTGLIQGFPASNPTSIVIGVAALVGLLAFKHNRFLPGALLVLAGGIAASVLLNLPSRGVAVAGPIDMHFAWPTWPQVSPSELSQIVQLTFPLALLLFAESWGTIRSLALRHCDEVDAGRELRALGFANVASAAVQGMPVGAGFSAGSANEAAGATSRAAGAIAALAVGAILLFGIRWIAWLPLPVLAAVVIVALTHALKLSPFLQLWKLGRDQWIAFSAVLAVLVLGVLDGMLFALALSLFAMLKRLASAQVAVLGRLRDSHTFVDMARHFDAVSPPSMMIFRPVEPLFFGNAEHIFGNIAQQAGKGIRAIVISLEESMDIDSTAAEAMMEFDKLMRGRGVQVRFARVHDNVRDVFVSLANCSLLDRFSFSVDEAVAAIAASAVPEVEDEEPS